MINHIQWPGSVKPVDVPSCGFDNSKCIKSNTTDHSVVAAGTLGLLLFCATVITASIYRKWKIEQEIEGLLWKIQSAELHSHKKSDMASPASKVSAHKFSIVLFSCHTRNIYLLLYECK
jgi:guanylate cyclase, other